MIAPPADRYIRALGQVEDVMRRFCSLLLALFALACQPATAGSVDRGKSPVAASSGRYAVMARFASRQVAIPPGIANYGPFRVLGPSRAALVDATDTRSPAAFAAMLSDFPSIVVLEMINCPGTEDDIANLRLGRMIHARGIATHVPDGGSVRSGAVDLFVAGARRLADPGAIFAVHAWEDTEGFQPSDYPADALKNREYLDYYEAMGMTAREAAAFYAMTNSVPFESVRWLTAAELGRWVRLDKPAA
jgi:hypothetical protein